MQIVYLNGRRLQLTWRELRAQLRHPLFVGMMLLMAFCLVLIGPYDHLLNFGALQLGIFYAVCFVSFSALLYFALWLCYRWDWPGYSLFTVSFACLGATVIGLSTALLLGAPSVGLTDMLLVTGFNLVYCFLGEILQSTFIIPHVVADLRGQARQDMRAGINGAGPGEGKSVPPLPATEGPQPETPAMIMIFGQCFAPASIHLIQAEEHYVALTLKDGTRHLLRGRIADAVAVLPPHLGRQVHRSYWVAATALAGFRPEKYGAQLVLTCGRSIPVARPRLAKVRCWAEEVIAAGINSKKAPQGVPPASS